jgi:DNA-binding CsgD family transcriptional regulator
MFGNLRGRKLRSDRHSAAVDHHHALRPFPATCLAVANGLLRLASRRPKIGWFGTLNISQRNSERTRSPIGILFINDMSRSISRGRCRGDQRCQWRRAPECDSECGSGLSYLPHVALDRLAERMPAVELTPRESEVLACITQGRNNREIAEELRIAEKTVRIHVSSFLDKIGARDRTQANKG